MLASSCSSVKNSIYESNFPLTSERAKSVSGNLSVQVPQGWYPTVDNVEKSFELWLNNKNNSATITFINIIADDNSIRSGKEDELHTLLNYSKIVKKAELGKSYKELEYDEYFELNGIPCAAFIFLNKENKKGRIVVFEFRGHYYESTATLLNGDEIDDNNLFVIQNSVLKSLY